MTTPDPIARHELLRSIECVIQRRWLANKIDGYTREMAIEIADALTPAPQVPADAVLRFLNHLEDVMDAHPEVADWVDVQLWNAISTPNSSAPSTPPLNELLGQPEEFNLNEVSGSSGQLASLEQRARELLAGECENSGFPEQAADLRIGLKLGGLPGVALRAITAALSAQPQSEVASEPGAIRTLVAAANAVLALHPADDGMWTLEQAVRPFNAVRPSECENGCPDNQVCDYCQFAAPQPRVTPEHWIEIGKAQALAEFTEQRAAQRRELLAAPQSSEVRSDTNWHECPHCKGWSRATTPQDAAGVEPAAWMATSKPSSDGSVAIQFTHNPDYANECRRADWTVAPLYTTPPPGVDVGKLRELVDRWRDEANAGYLTGKPEIDSITEARQHVYFECADKLDATMAEPGVKK